MKLVSGYAEIEAVDDFVDSLSAIAAEHDCTIQAIDARYVAGRAHLTRALELTDRAISRDVAIADDRSVELLLSIAGTRQIDRAFEVGVSTGRTPVVVVVDASEVDGPASQVQEQGAKAVESLLELATFDEIIADEDSLREWFEIDETELAATDASLETLVCERVALLSLER